MKELDGSNFLDREFDKSKISHIAFLYKKPFREVLEFQSKLLINFVTVIIQN